MSELELIARSIFYALSVAAICGGCFHWGWKQREALALKCEYFGVSATRWHKYDQQLKAGDVPKRAEIHDIRDRQSEK